MFIRKLCEVKRSGHCSTQPAANARLTIAKVTIADKFGVEMKPFASSTGRIDL